MHMKYPRNTLHHSYQSVVYACLLNSYILFECVLFFFKVWSSSREHRTILCLTYHTPCEVKKNLNETKNGFTNLKRLLGAWQKLRQVAQPRQTLNSSAIFFLHMAYTWFSFLFVGAILKDACQGSLVHGRRIVLLLIAMHVTNDGAWHAAGLNGGWWHSELSQRLCDFDFASSFTLTLWLSPVAVLAFIFISVLCFCFVLFLGCVLLRILWH